MKGKNKDITDLLFKLYHEVTPEGRVLLDKFVNAIIFQLEVIRQAVDLEER